MSCGRALVVGVNQYRTWDPAGGADLPSVASAAKQSAAVLQESDLELEFLANPTGAELREGVTRLVRTARDGKVPAVLVFVGSGATRRDGTLVLCGSDTDRTLDNAVSLDELAGIVADHGPPRIAVFLDCGFTGIASADRPTRTLTPHARIDTPPIRLFRASDVVVSRPIQAVVEDGSVLVDARTPIHAVVFEISGSIGGDFIDIRIGGETVGHVRVYPQLDPTVPPPFLAGRDYWFWRPTSPAWPDQFALRHDPNPPFGPGNATLWQSFDQAPFTTAAVVTENPIGRTYQIVRQPAAVESGFLELVEENGDVVDQIWYGVPGQVDAQGFFLFGPHERLEFARVEADLVGRSLLRLETPRRF